MWVEVERMPQQLYLQFEELEGRNGFDSRAWGVCCDYDSRVIPPCPYSQSGGGGSSNGWGGELHGFAYEPRLGTLVTGLLDQLTTIPFQHFSG
jgi:hypothetical protein